MGIRAGVAARVLPQPLPVTMAEVEAACKRREEFGTQGPPTH
jgi:hypothetical protein